MRRRWSQEEFAKAITGSHVRVAGTIGPREEPSPTRAFWPIDPTPAPRQVRKDTWDPSPSVLRYRAFRDEIARRGLLPPTAGDLVVFCMRIPRSWSGKKQREMAGQPHLPKPDADNLLKALLDACYGNDSHIWVITPAKVWSEAPGIYIERREPELRIPFTEHLELAEAG